MNILRYLWCKEGNSQAFYVGSSISDWCRLIHGMTLPGSGALFHGFEADYYAEEGAYSIITGMISRPMNRCLHFTTNRYPLSIPNFGFKPDDKPDNRWKHCYSRNARFIKPDIVVEVNLGRIRELMGSGPELALGPNGDD